MDTEQNALEPTRENVKLVAKRLTDEGNRPPSLSHLRHYFKAPTSPAIAVYFSEWKQENASLIASLRNTKEQWKLYAERQTLHLERASATITQLNDEISALTNFINRRFPNVWIAYQETLVKEQI